MFQHREQRWMIRRDSYQPDMKKWGKGVDWTLENPPRSMFWATLLHDDCHNGILVRLATFLVDANNLINPDVTDKISHHEYKVCRDQSPGVDISHCISWRIGFFWSQDRYNFHPWARFRPSRLPGDKYKVKIKDIQRQEDEMDYLIASLTWWECDLQITKTSWTPASASDSNVQSKRGALQTGSRHWDPSYISKDQLDTTMLLHEVCG